MIVRTKRKEDPEKEKLLYGQYFRLYSFTASPRDTSLTFFHKLKSTITCQREMNRNYMISDHTIVSTLQATTPARQCY